MEVCGFYLSSALLNALGTSSCLLGEQPWSQPRGVHPIAGKEGVSLDPV